MDWLLIAGVIIVIFAGAVACERWRVPLIRERALRRGFEPRFPATANLDNLLRTDAALVFGSTAWWQLGIILNRAFPHADAWVSEARLAASRGNRWHTMVSIHSQAFGNHEAIRELVSRHLPKAQFIVGNEQIVCIIRGLLWPNRLNALFDLAENLSGFAEELSPEGSHA